MAQVVRGRVGPYSRKLVRIVAPRFDLPGKYQRSCFHTSWILQVEGQRVLMPSLSPTMETGTIVKWMKKEGDTIAPGDVLADIQTDKAIVAMEMEDESVLAKIIIPEGSKDVKVGTLIALTVDAGEDWKSVEIPADVPAQGAAQQTAPSPPAAATVVATSPAPAAPAESAPEYQHNITMPSLSPTMTTGTIVKWVKKEGDTIQPGDVIADIQTDKAVMSFEIEDEAVLAKIILPEGSVVEVGELIAITVESGEDWKNVVVPAATAATPAASTAPKPPAVSAPAGASPPSSGQVYGLAVKRLLEEYNLSSGSIKGTGRPNRILKSDVLSYIQEKQLQKVAPKSAPPPAAPKGATGRSPSPPPKDGKVPKGDKAPKVEPSKYQDLPISNIRNVIAKRLAESKRTIPHSYAYIDIQMDKLNEMREKLKNEKINVSVNDFITKAVAHALIECPDINTLYQNDKIVHAQKVDISIAVSTPTGLITPIVVDAPTKSLVEISAKIKELAGKARDGKLKPEEFQGGSFTISNLGMFGIKEFCAIINPPQSAILAVGGGRQEIDCCLKPSTKMTAALSYDRRAIDEDQAADFLAVLRAMLEDPTFLAVGRAQAHRHRRA